MNLPSIDIEAVVVRARTGAAPKVALREACILALAEDRAVRIALAGKIHTILPDEILHSIQEQEKESP